MTTPRIIPGLSAVAADYDVLLCDVWGVIHNGRESFPEACAALAHFVAQGGEVVLVSNAPRPAVDVRPQLDALGVPRAAWTGFVTSGDATRAELIRRSPGPAWRLGPERDAPLYAGLDLRLTEGPQGAAFISCTGLIDDEIETPEDYRDAL
ncbi:MAG TPA: TIGR01459 family HAD-type hydrolase, partial [Caulobacteraceae bacterium]